MKCILKAGPDTTGLSFWLEGDPFLPHLLSNEIPYLQQQPGEQMSIYDFSAKSIDGRTVALSEYKGHVLLIVNTASECGFTPQYEGLEMLQKKYSEQAFSVLGFPCNQFGGQEPGDEDEIDYFCKTQYGIDFPMFAKVDVNGDDAHPLFKYLKKERPGFLGSGIIKWNFTKFLIGRNGEPIKRFAPTINPEDLQDDINDALAAARD